MLYAKVNGIKSRAIPNVDAICPCCEEEVIPKCGDVKIWHFAHKKASDCPNTGKGDWHYWWQDQFDDDYVEVRVEKGNRIRIADVLLPSGKVLEFQDSSISADVINQRERFYGADNLVWIFNFTNKLSNLKFYKSGNGRVLIEWKYPRHIITNCKAKVMLNIYGNLLYNISDERLYRLVNGKLQLFPTEQFDEGVVFAKHIGNVSMNYIMFSNGRYKIKKVISFIFENQTPVYRENWHKMERPKPKRTEKNVKCKYTGDDKDKYERVYKSPINNY